MRHRPRATNSIRLLTSLVACTALAITGVAVTHHVQADHPALKPAASSVPTPAHVVVVMEENHSYSDIIGNTSQAPYMNSLAGQGALMTSSYAVTHPSDPNYLALYAGNTFGLTADECPLAEGNTANLGSELLAAGDTFKGYSEGLPSTGSQTCTSGEYASKHSPWVNFTNVPAADQLPFSSFPSSSNYASLPTMSWVIPNLDDDMHDGTITEADTWLNTNLSAYATWAKTHNSLLIVTWDEDDYTENNQIPTIIVGQSVKTGQYSETISHYNLLATLEAMYGLAQVGSSAGLSPITDIWSGSTSGGGNTVTVTNPGTQTATVGTATSLQLAATDSATGQTFTWSATGLPAGLTISSSGLISGTPTASGTADVIATATDSSGATGSAAFTSSVNPATGADKVTVTNPGSQTGTVGTAASLQISGTDSASGQSLAYTATGLPPGLAIGSASGLISGTPTTAGTYTVTITADDTTGASGSTTFTWTVAAASSGCTAAQLLVNPGFETGTASPWTASSGVINDDTTEPPHTGTWDAWLDGYGSTHTDTLSQSITIPSTCVSATFSFWLHIDTAETTTTKQDDTLSVQVLNSSGTVLGTLATFSNLNAATGYTQHSYSLVPYIGQTVTLEFTGKENSSKQTSFVDDDNAVNVD